MTRQRQKHINYLAFSVTELFLISSFVKKWSVSYYELKILILVIWHRNWLKKNIYCVPPGQSGRRLPFIKKSKNKKKNQSHCQSSESKPGGSGKEERVAPGLTLAMAAHPLVSCAPIWDTFLTAFCVLHPWVHAINSGDQSILPVT